MHLGEGSDTNGEVALGPDELDQIGGKPEVTRWFPRTRITGQCQKVSNAHLHVVSQQTSDLRPGMTHASQMGDHRTAVTTRYMTECDVGDHLSGTSPVATAGTIGNGYEVRVPTSESGRRQ